MVGRVRNEAGGRERLLPVDRRVQPGRDRVERREVRGRRNLQPHPCVPGADAEVGYRGVCRNRRVARIGVRRRTVGRARNERRKADGVRLVDLVDVVRDHGAGIIVRSKSEPPGGRRGGAGSRDRRLVRERKDVTREGEVLRNLDRDGRVRGTPAETRHVDRKDRIRAHHGRERDRRLRGARVVESDRKDFGRDTGRSAAILRDDADIDRAAHAGKLDFFRTRADDGRLQLIRVEQRVLRIAPDGGDAGRLVARTGPGDAVAQGGLARFRIVVESGERDRRRGRALAVAACAVADDHDAVAAVGAGIQAVAHRTAAAAAAEIVRACHGRGAFVRVGILSTPAAAARAAVAGRAPAAVHVGFLAAAAAAARVVDGNAGNVDLAAVAARAGTLRAGDAHGVSAGFCRAAAAGRVVLDAIFLRADLHRSARVALPGRSGAAGRILPGRAAAAAAGGAGVRRGLVVLSAVAARAAAHGRDAHVRADDRGIAAVRAVGGRGCRVLAARADGDRVGRAARHAHRVRVDQAAAAAAAARVVAAGAAAAHDERVHRLHVRRRREREGRGSVRRDHERVDELVELALDRAARAGVAHAARLERFRFDVRVVGDVVDSLDLVGVGRERRQSRESSRERIARREARGNRRPIGGFRPGRRPGLREDLARRRRARALAAEDRDRPGEPDERRADVRDLVPEHGLGRFLERHDLGGREERRLRDRVVVGADAVAGRLAGEEAHFVDFAPEGALDRRAGKAADAEIGRPLHCRLAVEEVCILVYVRAVEVEIVFAGRAGRVVDDVELAPDVLLESLLHDIAGGNVFVSIVGIVVDAHGTRILVEGKPPGRRGAGLLVPDEDVPAQALAAGDVTMRADPQRHVERVAERVERVQLRRVGEIDDDARVVPGVGGVHAPRTAELAGGNGLGDALRVADEVLSRRVRDLRVAFPRTGLVEVPDAGVGRERVAGAEGLAALRRTVDHGELRRVGHRRERHPDERLVVRAPPRVDLERKAVALHVDEAEVLARVREHHVRIGEAGRRSGLDAHEDGEVRQDLVSGVSARRDHRRAVEAVRRGEPREFFVRDRPCGQGERGEREEGEEEFAGHCGMLRILGLKLKG